MTEAQPTSLASIRAGKSFPGCPEAKGEVAEDVNRSRGEASGRAENICSTVAIAESCHDAYAQRYGVMEHDPIFGGMFELSKVVCND